MDVEQENTQEIVFLLLGTGQIFNNTLDGYSFLNTVKLSGGGIMVYVFVEKRMGVLTMKTKTVTKITQPSTLARFHDRYTQILETKEPTRTMRLSNLMDDLKQVYFIPMRKNKMFGQISTRAMHLYWAVSRARNLEGIIDE